MTAWQRTVAVVALGTALLRDLLRYRDLWWDFILVDTRIRYAGSVLGPFWSLVHPFVMIALLVFVFSHALSPAEGDAAGAATYAMQFCAGFLPWLALQEIIGRSTTVFRDQASLVKKTAFPPVMLHASVAGSAAINFGILVALFLALATIAGHRVGTAVILWPGVLALQIILATGLGLCTSVANVFLRDVGHLVSAGLQIWFWLTPIVYPPTALPERYRGWLRLNPLWTYTAVQQDLVRAGRWPSIGELTVLCATSLLALGLGLGILARFRQRIPDEL
jgi:lipopolysaccharide transport system permease protein